MSQSSIHGRIGEPFIILPQVDSTNNYAMGQVHAGLSNHGTAYFAIDQYQGKGQRSKKWLSVPGENIAISYVLDTRLIPIEHQFLLSAATALCCYNFIKLITNLSCLIKWPNDVYINDRKTGGILIENVIRGNNWTNAIAGIGINVNQVQFPDGIGNPVSLKLVTGNEYDVLQAARLLSDCMNTEYENLHYNAGNVMDRYNQVLFRRNENVQLKKGETILETTILQVNEYGVLLTDKGEFVHGEIEWLL